MKTTTTPAGLTITLREATPEELADRAQRKTEQDKYEKAIDGFDSGTGDSKQVLTLQERLELIDRARDCVYDGNGPADLDGCFRLIEFVEGLR